MPVKDSKAGRLTVVSGSIKRGGQHSSAAEMNNPSGDRKVRNLMGAKGNSSGNLYHCAMERNQNGKYNIRIRVRFGEGGWSLSVYFLASSFNAAMKKLEQSLQLLQKNEDRLRFWGVERSDDPNLAGDLLQEFGLWLDRRREFPRKVAELNLPGERTVAASMLAPVRRVLADSVSQERERAAFSAAGD
jgi:hypothetical protein